MAAVPPKAPSRTLIVVLVTGMLVTGCSNSLWTKYQDMQCVENCDDPDPSKHVNFEQPVPQTLTMFSGELLCLVAYGFINSRFNPWRIHQRRRHRAAALGLSESSISLEAGEGGAGYDSAGASGATTPLSGTATPKTGSIAAAAGAEAEEGIKWRDAVLFWLPATADILGTTCMNVGLFFVPVSVYQMLRGALVLWVGVFSVIFLKRKLTRAQWFSLGVCMLGVAIVGAASLIGNPSPPASPDSASEKEGTVSPLVGVCLVLVAQIFTASQFVLEERIMEVHSTSPLLSAGYEGFFGFLTTAVAFLVAYKLYGSTPAGQGGYFDVVAGYHQIVDHPPVWGSSLVIAVSIALFNFCGLAVTRTVSATARSTIDTCRTVGIWAVSLALGWETFKLLQVIGFVVLVWGTFCFNGITSYPHWTGLHRDALPAGLYTSPSSEDLLPSSSSYRAVPEVVVEDTDASSEDDEGTTAAAGAGGVAGTIAAKRRKSSAAKKGKKGAAAAEGENAPLLG